ITDVPEAINQEIQKSLSIADRKQIQLFRGRGCEHCNSTGYYGRLAIYEILTLNDNIRAAVLEKPRSDYIKGIAVREGMKTLRQNAWQAALDGKTTFEEVIHVTVGDDTSLPQSKESNSQVSGYEELINKLAEKKIKEKYAESLGKANEV
ncbi:MAG: hypothetical protein KC684_03760, partial [Candidatus Omnitrophica bacterium]|nr:hypothetical protein [Candidatus Omnitrophota bacterium]